MTDLPLPWQGAASRSHLHGNCFDGCSSAGVFTPLFIASASRRARNEVSVVYRALEHKGDAAAFPSDAFDGDENACVDFRYSQDPRLTWWFDHHASAFQQPGDEAHFRADATGRKFYDPDRQELPPSSSPTPSPPSSASTSRRCASWSTGAEIVDGALFTDAKMAVELKEPALQLMTFIENNRDPALAERFHRRTHSSRGRSATIAAAPVRHAGAGAVAGAATSRTSTSSARAAKLEGGVVHFDVADQNIRPVQQVHHLLPLPPEARYSVGLNRARTPQEDLGRIEPLVQGAAHARQSARSASATAAARHPVVGAVSRCPRIRRSARGRIYAEIVAELQGPGSAAA